MQKKPTPQELKMEEYNRFCEEHPYSVNIRDYSRDTLVETDLIMRYAEIIGELNELGVTEEQCPKIVYGQRIVSLSEYEEFNEFIRCFYSTKKFYDDADQCFSNAAKSLQAGKNDLSYSSLKEAASKYESAYDIVLQYNQESPHVAELAECLKMMYNGATNAATGIYTNSTFLANVGVESLKRQALVYSVLGSFVQKIVGEVEGICAEIELCQ